MLTRRYSGTKVRIGIAVSAMALVASFGSTASAGGGLSKYEIVPGESIGTVALGMTRRKVQRELNYEKPKRHQDHARKLYSLTYHYPHHDRIGNRGGKLIIVFRGLSKRAHAGYMVTVENSLGTRGAHIGVGDTSSELLGSYPVHCYHADTDGTRHTNYEDNENSECELHSNGHFTYFSFASVDADPAQKIQALAISSIKVR